MEEDVRTMRQWIVLGAVMGLMACDGGDPKGTDPTDTDGTPPSDTEVEISYDNVQAIFDQSCATAGCHDGSVAPDLTAAASPASIVGVASQQVSDLNHIEPGDPDGSYLLLKVNGSYADAGGFGSQMPITGCCLADSEVQAISDWIAAGAPVD